MKKKAAEDSEEASRAWDNKICVSRIAFRQSIDWFMFDVKDDGRAKMKTHDIDGVAGVT